MNPTFKIIQARIESKRMYVMFRSDPEQPVLVPLIYQINKLKSKSRETIKKKLLAVKHLYEYYYSYKELDVDELLINKRHNIIFNSIQDFCIKVIYQNKNIGYHYKNATLNNVAEFLFWSIKRYNKNEEIALQVSNFITSNIRHVNYSTKNRKDFLTSEDVEIFFKFSEIEAIENPFKSHVKLRNYLIIRILALTGLRLGELLKLKCVDVIEQKNGNYYLEIQNREDELDDSRSDEPSLKNIQSERIVSIPNDLYKKIQLYILEFRRPIRNGKPVKLKNGYLLISERGLPLSKAIIYDLLKQLKSVINQSNYTIEKEVTPHSFRHFFSCSFLENLIEVQGIDQERAKDQLRIIGGWSMNSKMPEYYAKSYISKSANEHNIFRIENAYSKINDKKI